MTIPTHYEPNQVEQKWYQYWLAQGFFKARPNPNKKPYTIVMPPPNITGVLHMGHVLNNTLQDVLIRRARMQGREACWVPGIDHASIATEAKVVAMLQAKGIQKKDLTREAFLAHVWEWKDKYGSIILEQIKQLGASCDWDRLCFTMDPNPSEAVKDVFIKLYEEGYIYQGTRMINWDPLGKTALADDEVNYKPVASKLYYIRYEVVGSQDYVTIATTRPETILGDTAVCVHPDDTRYQHLHGKQVVIPIANRIIPIITDEYVDKDFGTGCLKVTPAHDMNDYELGKRHHLAIIDIFNEDGTLNLTAGHYVGEDRFVVREKIAQELQAQGYLIKIEPHTSNIGFSERTDAVVEPRLSKQWFVRIKELAKPALEHVLDDTIQFHPAKFKHMYQAWLENVQDWCISRQLWWGHRIPAFYLPDHTVIVAENRAIALAKAQARAGYENLTEADIRQDEDVLDTWFSAWLWPINVFKGFEDSDNEAMRYFYPTNDLVTAPEIIFFWVARMIMAGYAFTQKPPFKNVYFTGIVRDKLGRKMSKSLGNSPDPLELIKQYGADGVRVGMLFSSPAGNDLLFDIKLCEQGRNFANKLWNIFRLLKGWEIATDGSQAEDTMAISWFNARLNQALATIENHFEQFRISDALMAIYKLIWDDFCAWYLEMIKPPYGQPISSHTYAATVDILEILLKILHPFMPFITEEIWHQLQPRTEQDCMIVASWPKALPYDKLILEDANLAFTLITEVRNIRANAGISPKEVLSLYTDKSFPTWFKKFNNYIQKLGHVALAESKEILLQNSISFTVQEQIFYIPLLEKVDKDQEIARLHKELAYYQGFLEAVTKKLDNTRFLQQAPKEVVAVESKKKADAIEKIKLIENRLLTLRPCS
ncbi:MAG: valine--tRNA ligase [Candidatus Amoebophilus sp. 36-38]|nr:MAG: valine--tRNA ligase [Candidatus Amoebophilus sp. 36-38]